MSFENFSKSEKLLHVARSFIQQNDFQNASRACNALNKSYPDLAEGWHATFILSMRTSKPSLALRAIEKSISLQPKNPIWVLQKIHCLTATDNSKKAIQLALILAQTKINDANTCDELALFLCDNQCFSEAKQLFLSAIYIDPQSSRRYFNLATVQRFLGEVEDSVSSCDQSIKLDTHNYDAHFLRSSLVKQTPSENHIQQLKSLLDKKIESEQGRVQICYSLAKELEDCGQYESSFEARKQGADLYRSLMDYDAASDLAFIDKIIEVYNQDTLNQPQSGYNNDEAIFILGLPRSGSTLLDRIISSHSEVHSAGELTNFTHQMVGMMQSMRHQPNPTRTDMVSLSSQLDFKSLGRAYIQSTRPGTGQKKHFTDKFPPNVLYAGLLHLALPQSRIVLMQRHPLDTCYAIYKQLFTDIYHFSYTLDELADYFIAHQKLMDHWLSVMQDHIHVVRYENLVHDLEGESRKVLEFCGLDWQAQCLDFHRNKQASTTASASQVRQKLYTSSIGLWRNYEQQLKPLVSQLEDAGCLQGWPM